MMVNKEFRKFVDDGTDRSIAGIEGKSISRKISIPVRTKHSHFHGGRSPL